MTAAVARRVTSTKRDWARALRHLLLAAPAVILLGCIFGYPILRLLTLGATGGSFLPYRQVLGGDGPYLLVLWATLRISLATVALCVLLGYPVAYFLATASRLWRTIGFVFVLLPFWTSMLVRTYAWIALLGRNGVINRTLIELGIIDQPLQLLYNFGGVLIGIVHVLLPYMVFPIYASLVRIDPNVVLAAEGLGAGGFAVFWRIYLPLTASGVFAGAALVFTLSLGAFVTPALLGGGRIIMIANLIQQEISQFIDWPLASALAGILLAVVLPIYAGFSRSLRGARDVAV
jgi:ABC-type spermidine/putrescine transport system permease subunit I